MQNMTEELKKILEKVVEKILNSEIEKYFYTNDFHEIELKEFCGISWDFVKLFKVQ